MHVTNSDGTKTFTVSNARLLVSYITIYRDAVRNTVREICTRMRLTSITF